jgi:RNA polymerase sigma factor (sigma-70 family)
MVTVQRWCGSAQFVGPGEVEQDTVEAALLKAGRAGDAVALERLLALHKGALYAFCLGIMRNPDDAEDAVQETFLRALHGLAGYRGEAAFRSWLFRIAVNLCLRWQSTHRATGSWHDEWAAADPSPSPEALALRHLQVMEALRHLLPRQRALLLLKEREGWSIAEIAAAFCWNEKRVENELSRARRTLAEWRRRVASEGDRS